MDNCKRDTAFIDKPSFDTTGLTFITEKNFDDPIGANRFYGSVIKLKNIPAPIDGELIYYLTQDLGIIYSKSATWPCYRRLHSTNDSIETRINKYLEHILLSCDLVIDGELPPKESLNFTLPHVLQ